MWCQSSRDPSENSHYMIIPAHTPHHAFNLPILYRKLQVFARIQHQSSTIANIIQNTLQRCDFIERPTFSIDPQRGWLCRADYAGEWFSGCILGIALCYTHMIMHYAAGKFWPLVPGGVARGARSTYQTDFELWCLNWQHIPILATMCEKLHGQIESNCYQLMCMAIRA